MSYRADSFGGTLFKVSGTKYEIHGEQEKFEEFVSVVGLNRPFKVAA